MPCSQSFFASLLSSGHCSPSQTALARSIFSLRGSTDGDQPSLVSDF